MSRIDKSTQKSVVQILKKFRVDVAIVTSNAEKDIEKVLEGIPVDIAEYLEEICVFDDSSDDWTYETAIKAGQKLKMRKLKVFRTPMDRGYGGIQKIVYTYAIKNKIDFVIMLHGDGQYGREYLYQVILTFADVDTDMVVGSHMYKPMQALKGELPLHKWLGDVIITWIENKILGTNFSGCPTRYRAFRLEKLRSIPFQHNSDDLNFDTEILIQFISSGCKIVEIPIPTHYQIRYVNGLGYAWHCFKCVVKYRLFTIGLFYDPLFDFGLFETGNYYLKKARNSLHQYVLKKDFSREVVLDIGAGRGYISAEIAGQASRVVALDYIRPLKLSERVESLAVDLNNNFESNLGLCKFDTVLALDVIEHLKCPEVSLQQIARVLKNDGRVFASTGNISFFIVRIMLLIGIFNYGKRGILDRTHSRLFTVRSFKHLFQAYGFEVEKIRGFGPPIRDLISEKWPVSWVDSILGFLARIIPGFFSYSFLLEARRKPTLEESYEATIETIHQE